MLLTIGETLVKYLVKQTLMSSIYIILHRSVRLTISIPVLGIGYWQLEYAQKSTFRR